MKANRKTTELPAEELLHVLDDLKDIIFRLDCKGNFTFVNKAALRLTGYSKKEAYSLSLKDVIAPEAFRHTLENFRRRMRGENPTPYETVLLDKQGGRHTLVLTAATMYSDGGVVGEIGVAHDITDRKKIEDELLKSGHQYRSTIDSMGDAIHVVDRDLRIILANKAFRRWLKTLGLDGVIIGKGVFEAFPFLGSVVRAEYREVFNTGRTMVTTESHPLGGRTIHTETRKIPVVEDEEVVRVVTVIRDITDSKRAEEELRDSEERYRCLFEQSPIGIGLATPEGVVVTANTAMEGITGYSIGELQQVNLLDTYENQKDRKALLMAIRRYGGVSDFHVRLKRKDGTFYDALLTVSRVHIGGRDLLQTICVDITERKKMEGELRDSEERYRRLVHLSPDAIVVHSGGKIVYVNKAGLKLFKVSSLDSAVGKPVIDFVHPDYRELVKERVRKVYAEGRAGKLIEEKMIRADGKTIDVEVAVAPITYKGKPAAQVVVRDITERKRMEKELLGIKTHLEAVLNGISESIVVIDKKYRIVSHNQAFQRWIGKPKVDLRGRKCYKVIHGFDSACRKCVVRDAFGTGIPSESIHYHQTDGRRTYHETKAFPVLMDGEVKHTIYVFRDVTDRELLKEQARQNYEKLVKANEELRKLDRMKTEFLSIASHELRTPLSIIIGYADVLSSETLGDLNQQQKRRLGRIRDNAEHLNLLVNNILDLTRIDAGEVRLKRKRFSVGRLVGEVMSDMSHLAREKNIRLRSKVKVKSRIRADRARLKQVIVNLVDNALKFTPAGGRITVSAYERGGKLILRVADNGIGMRKKDLDSIFRRFFQVDSSTQRKYKGAGLGLAICRRIVELHGGEIRIKSALGDGTTVTVALPLSDSRH